MLPGVSRETARPGGVRPDMVDRHRKESGGGGARATPAPDKPAVHRLSCAHGLSLFSMSLRS